MKPEGALFIYNILVDVGFYGSRKEGVLFFPYIPSQKNCSTIEFRKSYLAY